MTFTLAPPPPFLLTPRKLKYTMNELSVHVHVHVYVHVCVYVHVHVHVYVYVHVYVHVNDVIDTMIVHV